MLRPPLASARTASALTEKETSAPVIHPTTRPKILAPKIPATEIVAGHDGGFP